MSIYKALGFDPSKLTQSFDRTTVSPFQGSGRNKLTSFNRPLNPKQQNLNPWQEKFKKRIIGRLDSMVNVPPAAGKTRPILEAWYELLSSALKNKSPSDVNFPRLLFVVPTRQLAVQISHTDILREFHTGLMRIYIERFSRDLQSGHKNQPYENKPLTQEDRKKAYQWANDTVMFVSGDISTSAVKSGIYHIKPIIVATYEKANEIISKYSRFIHTVIIDETQEFLPKPGYAHYTSDVEERSEAFHSIISKISKHTGLNLLTGSININTTNKIIELINHMYHRKLVLIPGNPESVVADRSRIFIQPVEKITDASYRKKLILDLVKSQKENVVMISFSVKRSSVNGIFRILEDIVDDLPKRNPESLYDILPNKIRDEKTEKLRDLQFRDLPDIERQNLVEKIKGSDKHPLPESLPSGGDQKRLNVNDIEYLKYFNIDSTETGKGEILSQPDPNNLLYRSILGGVGVMVGKMPDDFKLIMQKLFMSGKIYVLLATNSLGVGANIKAKDLYIPSLDKFEGDKFKELDDSSLVQLVNRAGRGAFKTATIYTSLKDYEKVKYLLQTHPTIGVGEVEELPFERFERMVSKTGFLNKIRYSIYKSFIKTI